MSNAWTHPLFPTTLALEDRIDHLRCLEEAQARAIREGNNRSIVVLESMIRKAKPAVNEALEIAVAQTVFDTWMREDDFAANLDFWSTFGEGPWREES